MYFTIKTAFERFAQGDIVKVERCEKLGPDDIGLFLVDGSYILARHSAGELVGRVVGQFIFF